MTQPTRTPTLDVARLREQFPILSRQIKPGKPLVYLDSTATSQKPLAVIEAMSTFYRQHNANIHRGIYQLAEEATAQYEAARSRVARFIGAADPSEIIFTRNTTESINLVMRTWAQANLGAGDVVLLTEMEHHSNIVPWQMLSVERGVKLEFVPVSEAGVLDMAVYDRLLERRPKLVSLAHMSNVLGTVNPVADMADKAHAAGAVVTVDGAQSVPHMRVDVGALGADFLAFSSHKMCGPTGIGILYGRRELLDRMPPFLGGGDMIKRVRLHEFSTNEPPHKFEAGTPAIAEAIGLGAAIEFLDSIGMDAIHAHERDLIAYTLDRMSEVPGVRVYGPDPSQRGGVASFVMQAAHPHDVAQILDAEGVAVRAGHHCAMPLHERFGIMATTRASFYLYNTREDVDRLVAAVQKVNDIFA